MIDVLLAQAPPVQPPMESQAAGWTVLLPEVALFGGALLLLLVDAATPKKRGRVWAILTFGVLAVAAVLSVRAWTLPPQAALGDMVVGDRFGAFVRWVVIGSAALVTLSAHSYLRERKLDRAELYALLLLATGGMTLLGVSADLIMVFLAIELLSLALYVMTGFERDRMTSLEGAMKYFLLGAFASAFLLYGIAFVFGGMGTTNLIRITELLDQAAAFDFQLIGIAVALLVVGLGFKASMVPFHMWTPDAYQGAPTPVTAFMAAGTKAAAFAALVRVLIGAMAELRWDWQPPVAILVALTVVFASVLAISQTDVKRMLAYSSVAHAGFIGLGVLAVSRTGVASVLLYLLVYAAMTIGAFGCVMLFREGTPVPEPVGTPAPVAGGSVQAGISAIERVHLAKYSGLGAKRPFAAALFAFFLFALAGIPPTGGFWAKWYVFFAAIRADFAWLAVLAVLASVAAAFFYVRVAVVMFMQEPPEGDDMPLARTAGLRLTLAICALIVLAVGVFPEFFLDLATQAAQFGGG